MSGSCRYSLPVQRVRWESFALPSGEAQLARNREKDSESIMKGDKGHYYAYR